MDAAQFESALVNRLTGFLQDIGLPVRSAHLETPTFLPGVTLSAGTLLADESRLLYPGDLLHEAGHLAILAPAERATATAPLDPDLGMEIGAIAWSWAALKYLDLDPALVFHDAGYQGASKWFIEIFSSGRSVGVPLLQWMEMTTGADFPVMLRWLRPAPNSEPEN
jgi:hypothetical protein